MTREELWRLFPVVLTPHQPQWADWAKDETELLSGLLCDYNPVISHIGSTAIPDIQAKPTIDILVEVPAGADRKHIRQSLEKAGYICMSFSDSRISFNKGYTPEGYAEKVFHIHIRNIGDNDEIAFRDYLTDHPEAAREYERLKLSLLPQYKYDRDGYTEAKSGFIAKILDSARR